MTRPSLSLAALGAALLMAGCSPPEAPKTVAYYAEHQDERQARLALCRNDPGQLKGDPDCVNAAAAVMKAWSRHDMPPITFAPVASAASR